MELRHLRYFVAVAEEMNMHRAAARLHISQPPLSLTIKQLEDEIGVPLFTREGRSIQITRAGELYLTHARKILAESQYAAEQARHYHLGIAGTLRIGFVSSTITGILQATVAAYKNKYPSVVLEINQSTNSNIPMQLLAGEIDVGILRLPDIFPAGIEVIEKSKESWYAALPENHLLTSKKIISLKDLSKRQLIFYPRKNTARGYDDVMDMFREHDVVPEIYQEATEQMTIAGLVASGMGIGIVPQCMAAIKIPGVTHRPIKEARNKTGFAFVLRTKSDVLAKNFCAINFKG